MAKTRYARDGWIGGRFARLREQRGLSPTIVAGMTGSSVSTLRRYESDQIFPSHAWRDKASVALRIKRAVLGLPGDK